MLSKRIGTPAFTYTQVQHTYNNYKAIEFPNQYEYDEWLKENAKFKPGDLLVLNSISKEALLQDKWPVITVVLRIEDDLPSLNYEQYGSNRGQPQIYEVRSVRTSSMAFDVASKMDTRMDTCKHYRMLTTEEVDYVMSHDLISPRLKALLGSIPGYPLV